jgi:hypothetical protein
MWCDFDGQCLRANTMRGFAKEQNMLRNPRVTLLCCDPCRPLRCLKVRGMVAEMTEAGAAEHLDALASKYAGQPVRFFGGAIPCGHHCVRGRGPLAGRRGQPGTGRARTGRGHPVCRLRHHPGRDQLVPDGRSRDKVDTHRVEALSFCWPSSPSRPC